MEYNHIKSVCDDVARSLVEAKIVNVENHIQELILSTQLQRIAIAAVEVSIESVQEAMLNATN